MESARARSRLRSYRKMEPRRSVLRLSRSCVISPRDCEMCAVKLLRRRLLYNKTHPCETRKEVWRNLASKRTSTISPCLPPSCMYRAPLSLRASSTNTRLVRATAALAPEGMEFTLYDGLADLPHFSPDLDGDEPPAPVHNLRKLL